MQTDKLLHDFPIISDQIDRRELRVLMLQLEHRLRENPAGNIVEFGCYVGTTTLFIRRLCDAYTFAGELHVYDSFAGLPEKTHEDSSVVGEQFVAGALQASRKTLLQNFKKAGLCPPIVHKNWFNELAPNDVPDEIFFAFLDGDYYESIRDSLRLVTQKLRSQATIIVDDYANEALPGAARATDEWCKNRQLRPRVEASLAVILID